MLSSFPTHPSFHQLNHIEFDCVYTISMEFITNMKEKLDVNSMSSYHTILDASTFRAYTCIFTVNLIFWKPVRAAPLTVTITLACIVLWVNKVRVTASWNYSKIIRNVQENVIFLSSMLLMLIINTYLILLVSPLGYRLFILLVKLLNYFSSGCYRCCAVERISDYWNIDRINIDIS